MTRILTVLAVLALPTFAFADRADADKCAQNLSAQATRIYKSGISMVESGRTLEQAIRPYLEPLVQTNRMTEADAHKYGREAAECMRLVHRKESSG